MASEYLPPAAPDALVAEVPPGFCRSWTRFFDVGGAGLTAAGNSCRIGGDAKSGVNGEVVLASPKAYLGDVCTEPVVDGVVNIFVKMAPIYKIHAYL